MKIKNQHPESQQELDEVFTYLVATVPDTKDKHFRRHAKINLAGMTGKDTTLDYWYVKMINDTLHQIRSGEVAYIFNVQALTDILRFVKDVRVSFVRKGIYSICKEGD